MISTQVSCVGFTNISLSAELWGNAFSHFSSQDRRELKGGDLIFQLNQSNG